MFYLFTYTFLDVLLTYLSLLNEHIPTSSALSHLNSFVRFNLRCFLCLPVCLKQSIIMIINVSQCVNVVDTADMRRRYGAKRTRRLQIVAVIQGRRCGARPVGETRRPHTGSDEVQFRNPGEGNRGEVTLKFVDGLLGGGRLAHLRQTVEIKLVGVSLAVYFSHDVFVVIIAQRPAQFVVVHIGFALSFPPPPGHLVRVYELELAVGALPGNARHVVAVREELQQKLPQLDLPTA